MPYLGLPNMEQAKAQAYKKFYFGKEKQGEAKFPSQVESNEVNIPKNIGKDYLNRIV